MRAAAIILDKTKVALIKRQCEGMVYYLFPGGTVEDSETPEQAVVREVKEELGLDVNVKQLVARVIFGESIQLYYLASVKGGKFGTGNGDEYSDQKDPADGYYLPVQMSLGEILTNDVRPSSVAKLVVSSVKSNWPPSVQEFIETAQ